MSSDGRRGAGARSTAVAAGDLRVEESGSPGAPAVVFLHGVGNSGGMWVDHMACLSSFHCLAPDLPGFGLSNHLPWESMARTADLVAELIRARVPVGRAHLVGLSMGGGVAHTLLARHPGLLDRVLIESAGVLPLWGTPLFNAAIAAFTPFLHTRLVVGGIARAFQMDEKAKDDLRAASPAAFRRGLTQANRIRLTREEAAAPCPTLLVAGEKDIRVVRASNAALAHVLPAAEAWYMPGLGHGWVGRAPEVHRRMVEAWIIGSPLPEELKPETTPWPRATVDHLIGRAPD